VLDDSRSERRREILAVYGAQLRYPDKVNRDGLKVPLTENFGSLNTVSEAEP
jgi:hypothetical protein